MAKSFKIGGTPTKRMRILMHIANNGASTKEEIIKDVWGYSRNHFNSESYWNSNVIVNNMRGWASTTFGEMVKDGRLTYDYHTRKWDMGKQGWQVVAKHLMSNIK